MMDKIVSFYTTLKQEADKRFILCDDFILKYTIGTLCLMKYIFLNSERRPKNDTFELTYLFLPKDIWNVEAGVIYLSSSKQAMC